MAHLLKLSSKISTIIHTMAFQIAEKSSVFTGIMHLAHFLKVLAHIHRSSIIHIYTMWSHNFNPSTLPIGSHGIDYKQGTPESLYFSSHCYKLTSLRIWTRNICSSSCFYNFTLTKLVLHLSTNLSTGCFFTTSTRLLVVLSPTVRFVWTSNFIALWQRRL